MDDVDLNLLVALDALLAEGSVTGAARRLGLSASAMSRTLARLRAATGDPLLVRAGRKLVPTPRAAALRARVEALTREARSVLRPAPAEIDLDTLSTTFTIRVSEGFMASLAAPVVAAVTAAAPGVCLRFVPKPDKHAGPLRDGTVDLEIGVLGTTAPELRTRTLFRDGFVGAVRTGHPLLDAAVTPERYAACRHVVAARRDRIHGPVDDALAALGLRRTISVAVPGYPDALRMARTSDLVALVPRSCLAGEANCGPTASGITAFALPVPTPGIAVAAIWHPRLENDSNHRWLRAIVASVCRTALGSA